MSMEPSTPLDDNEIDDWLAWASQESAIGRAFTARLICAQAKQFNALQSRLAEAARGLVEEPEEMDDFRKWETTQDGKIIIGYIDALAERAAALVVAHATRADRMQTCLALFKSVIKSGEPWTDVCQRDYDAAMKVDAHIAAGGGE